MSIVYVLVALFATVIGAVSGMGGGVIMKPIFDMMGQYDASEIAVMTSTTVLVMSIVSVTLNLIKRKRTVSVPINKWVVLLLAIGSVGGGFLGSYLFDLLASKSVDAIVKIVQNTVLLAIIIFIALYMHRRGVPFSLHTSSKIVSVCAGAFIGVLSSFLGIGGGPLNVAIILFLFGYSLKDAALCSLVTMIFAQISKIVTIILEGGTAAFNINILPFILIAGVVGAVIGRFITYKASEKGVKVCFTIVEIIIVGICIYNLVKYSQIIYI